MSEAGADAAGQEPALADWLQGVCRGALSADAALQAALRCEAEGFASAAELCGALLTDADLRELGLPMAARKRVADALARGPGGEHAAEEGEAKGLAGRFCGLAALGVGIGVGVGIGLAVGVAAGSRVLRMSGAKPRDLMALLNFSKAGRASA